MKLTYTQQNALRDIRADGNLIRRSAWWPWQHSTTGRFTKFDNNTVRALVRRGLLKRGSDVGGEICTLVEPNIADEPRSPNEK